MCEIWLKSVLYDYVKYNEFVTFCIFPFLFLVTYNKNDWFLMHDDSYDADSCKEVPFGGLDNER